MVERRYVSVAITRTLITLCVIALSLAGCKVSLVRDGLYSSTEASPTASPTSSPEAASTPSPSPSSSSAASASSGVPVDWIGNGVRKAIWETGAAPFAVGREDGTFYNPRALVVDKVNNYLYVVDDTGYRVQRFRLSDGAQQGAIGYAIASNGTCTAGTAGGGWCTGGVFQKSTLAGGFDTPCGIAIDTTAGFLLVVDQTNHRVQKFNLATGAHVATIGSNGTSDGLFSTPQRIATDGAGFFYVSDNAHRVQKFNLSTNAHVGTIGKSSLAGTCIAGAQTGWCTGGTFSSGALDGQFNSPREIAVNATDLYVADSNNHRIQRFSLAGAVVGAIGKSTAAGTCVAGAQTTWCTGGTFSSGALDGQFNGPSQVAITATHIYVGDSNNSRVQKFNIAGGSSGSFVGAIGNSTAVGTCSAGAQTSWCTGGSFSAVSTDGGFNGVNGIAVDSVGDLLYAGDANNQRVQRFTLSSGVFQGALGGAWASKTSWALTGRAPTNSLDNTNGADMADPKNMALDGSGFLLVVNHTGNRVNKYNATTGAYVGSIGNSSATGTCSAGAQTNWCTGGTFSAAGIDGAFSAPYGISVVQSQNFFLVGDKANHRITKHNLATGAFMGAVGKSTAAGSCIAGAQTAWCSGGTFSAGALDGQLNSPRGVAADVTNGFFYVADNANSRIQKFNLSSGAFVGSIGNSTATGTCVAGGQTSWCTGGTFSAGGGDGMFSAPNELIVQQALGAGYLYVNDYSNHRISRYSLPNGTFAGAVGNVTAAGGTCTLGAQSAWCSGGTFGSGNGDGMLNSPRGIVIDESGNKLYVLEELGYRISRFNLTTGAFDGALGNVISSSGTCQAPGYTNGFCTGGTFARGDLPGMFHEPVSLHLDPTATYLYASEFKEQRVQRFRLK